MVYSESLKKNGFTEFILPIGTRNLIKKYLKSKDFNNYNLKIIPTGDNTPIAKEFLKSKDIDLRIFYY